MSGAYGSGSLGRDRGDVVGSRNWRESLNVAADALSDARLGGGSHRARDEEEGGDSDDVETDALTLGARPYRAIVALRKSMKTIVEKRRAMRGSAFAQKSTASVDDVRLLAHALMDLAAVTLCSDYARDERKATSSSYLYSAYVAPLLRHVLATTTHEHNHARQKYGAENQPSYIDTLSACEMAIAQNRYNKDAATVFVEMHVSLVRALQFLVTLLRLLSRNNDAVLKSSKTSKLNGALWAGAMDATFEAADASRARTVSVRACVIEAMAQHYAPSGGASLTAVYGFFSTLAAYADAQGAASRCVPDTRKILARDVLRIPRDVNYMMFFETLSNEISEVIDCIAIS